MESTTNEQVIVDQDVKVEEQVVEQSKDEQVRQEEPKVEAEVVVVEEKEKVEEETSTTTTTTTTVMISELKIDEKPQEEKEQVVEQPQQSSTSEPKLIELLNLTTTPINSETGVDYGQVLVNPKFHMNGWLWIHAIARNLYTMINNKLKNWKPDNGKDIKLVVRAILEVDNFLECHHKHEDTIVWPWFIQVKPDIKPILDDMEGQHHEWDEMSKKLHAIVKELDDLSNGTDFSAFPEINARLVDIHIRITQSLMHHFADEERLLIPHVYEIDKQQQDQIIKKIHQVTKSDKGAKFALCAMVDYAKHDAVVGADINKKLPWFVRRILANIFARNDYKWFQQSMELNLLTI